MADGQRAGRRAVVEPAPGPRPEGGAVPVGHGGGGLVADAVAGFVEPPDQVDVLADGHGDVEAVDLAQGRRRGRAGRPTARTTRGIGPARGRGGLRGRGAAAGLVAGHHAGGSPSRLDRRRGRDQRHPGRRGGGAARASPAREAVGVDERHQRRRPRPGRRCGPRPGRGLVVAEHRPPGPTTGGTLASSTTTTATGPRAANGSGSVAPHGYHDGDVGRVEGLPVGGGWSRRRAAGRTSWWRRRRGLAVGQAGDPAPAVSRTTHSGEPPRTTRPPDRGDGSGVERQPHDAGCQPRRRARARSPARRAAPRPRRRRRRSGRRAPRWEPPRPPRRPAAPGGAWPAAGWRRVRPGRGARSTGRWRAAPRSRCGRRGRRRPAAGRRGHHASTRRPSRPERPTARSTASGCPPWPFTSTTPAKGSAERTSSTITVVQRVGADRERAREARRARRWRRRRRPGATTTSGGSGQPVGEGDGDAGVGVEGQVGPVLLAAPEREATSSGPSPGARTSGQRISGRAARTLTSRRARRAARRPRRRGTRAGGRRRPPARAPRRPGAWATRAASRRHADPGRRLAVRGGASARARGRYGRTCMMAVRQCA